ncbi:Tar ligand binding domain-containing protein [Opitutus sp. GAS368]|uniref:Tar ligand binding domain-containing protein n=1 Tax=Opitutus sp. GAS368 TaxID=1882749 RepID=UPI0008796BE9|nr:Tar ligand binding domain-containing protein [Opitutus sp. GAS368]SDS46725.1 Four helix bundle sensory module for signal transduction [Opitutus sp. GAS368]
MCQRHFARFFFNLMRLNFSALRRWLVLGLIASNLALGGLSFVLLRGLDSEYSELLGRSVPILAQLHGISVNLIRSRRAMLDALAAQTDAERARLLDRAVYFEHVSAKLRLDYQRSPDLVNGEAVDFEIETAARDFKAGMEQFIALVRAGRTADANEFRASRLRLLVDRYYDIIEKRVTLIGARAEQINLAYTQGNGLRAKVVLLLASWPFVATLVVGCVLVVTLIALLVAVLKPIIVARKPAA